MTPAQFEYIGGELELFADARNWRRYWMEQIRPFLGRHVLEVGAGIGSVTEALWSPAVASWLALEPDPALCGKLVEASGERPRPGLEIRCGTVSTLPSDAMFDTAIYIDVMEHIEDDRAEMACVARHVRPGGHVVVLAPAHQFLFTPFDAAIGHHRRYDRRSLARLETPGLRRVLLRYLDSVGLLASLGNRLLLRSAMPTPRQIAVWDRGMVPVSRRLDGILSHMLGKSILAVWQRDDPVGAER